jgi:catechol 2,3-dioxygenase-like lactoylglutathione lyase family enzyme
MPPAQSNTASLSHIVIYCFDFEKMLRFYTQTLGFQLSDIGEARGNRICFLTFDRAADHHQIALAGGRQGEPGAGALNHIAFRVGSLGALRERFDRLKQANVADLETITHGSWFSVYYRDPEGNRLEFFCDAPYYVKQPVVDKLDLSLSDEAILAATVDTYGKDPSFKPMAEWKAEKITAS